MKLDDNTLLRSKCYIDGEWTDAESGKSVLVTNPATGEVLTAVPDAGASETRRGIVAAQVAQPAWRAKTAGERAGVLRRWRDLMLANQEDLARLMTAEQGKPLAESRGEIAYAAAFIEWFAEEGKRIYGDIVPAHHADKRVLVTKEPIGVCAAITPWNFPAAMITRKAGPALAAGCAMIVKPAEATPLSALALAELAARAGVPKGIFSVVTGDAREIGGEMCANPTVRKLSFTGSTEVGRILMAQCAPTIKKLSLELGGNAPFIVFDDANLEQAVQGAMASKYRNAGQTCVCANRLLVQDGIYDAFVDRLATAVAGLKVGDGTAEGVSQGPLIDEAAVAKVEELIDDARTKGARVICGGRRHSLGRTYFEPTILADATAGMRIAREEVFGPVAPAFRFKTEAEAVAMANDTEYGLASYFYTENLARAMRVSSALEYGIVGVNTGLISTEVAPFGGMKSSGLGREGSKYGIEDYLEIKHVCIGGIE
ncbi:MAG: NAD-dependent succinate-semialdehyde dehydrogenase [Rhodocyclaceae bacterium]|nr:NAD-dependent succinate-semialdehyde dehydrogenase [Rhodocyclaceae bacterium]